MKVGDDIIAVGDKVDASLDAGVANVKLSEAEFGLKVNGSAVTFELSNGTFTLAVLGLVNISATNAFVQYTSHTGGAAKDEKLTVGSLEYIFTDTIAIDTLAFMAKGFHADITGFVSLDGDLGFMKVGDDIIAVGDKVDAVLEAGIASVSLTNAKFGLKVNGAAVTFELSNGDFDVDILGMTITGGDALVQYTSHTGGAAKDETLTVGSLEYKFIDAIAADTIAFAVAGLNLTLTGFVTLSGDFGFEKTGADPNTKILVGASKISTFLGTTNESMGIRVTDADLGLVLYANGKYALDASADAMLVGFDAFLKVDGSLGVRVNTTGGEVHESLVVGSKTISIDFSADQGTVQGFSGNLDLEILGFVTLSGYFAFEKEGTDPNTKILVGASKINAFLGTSDKSMGIQVTDADLGLVLYANGKYALDASAAAALVGFDGILELDGTLGVRVNTTGGEVHESIAVDGQTPVGIDFSADQGNVQGFSGSLDLIIAGFVTLSGDFAFEKSGTDPNTKLLVGASKINAFLGTSDKSMGIQVTDADLGLVLYANGKYALDASAAAALVGFDSILELDGTLGVRVNTTGGEVHESIAIDGQTPVSIDFSADQGNVQGFSGSLDLIIAGFVTLSGYFAFEKNGTDPNTKILVGASKISTFLGTADKSMGIQVTDADLGLVLYANKKYALDASAAAKLVGFDNILDLDGTLGVRVNTTGGAVHESITINGQAPVNIDFTAAQGNEKGFSGSLDLIIAGFVTISGDFAFEKDGTEPDTKLLVGASKVSVFLGSGAGTDDKIGFQISNGSLGLVLYGGSKYALYASGQTDLVGLDGLGFTGTFSVQINKAGKAVDETITSSGVHIQFTSIDDIEVFSGADITLSIASIFTLSGSITATILPSGTVLMDIPSATLKVTKKDENSVDQVIFSISAAIRFSISKADGFRLNDFRITGFDFMGVGADVAPKQPEDVQAMFTKSLPVTSHLPSTPPDATLEFPLNGGQVDISALNTRKYIDVTYNDYSGTGLKLSTIDGSEFTFSGTGKGDVKIDSVEALSSNTFRYHLIDSNPDNKVDLFLAGSVTIEFAAEAWEDMSGNKNAADSTQGFTVLDGGGAAQKTLSMGPVKLANPSIGIQDFQFKLIKNNGTITPRLLITIGMGIGTASIDFEGGTKVALSGLKGAFQIAVDLDINDLLAIPDVSLTGKFSIGVDTLSVEIPDILKVNGTSIRVNYDPNGAVDQELISVQRLSVTITPIQLTGALEPYTRPSDGKVMLGLVVRNNGFAIGTASLEETGTLSIPSLLELTGIKEPV